MIILLINNGIIYVIKILFSCTGERIPFHGRILFPLLLGEPVICQNGYVLGCKKNCQNTARIFSGTKDVICVYYESS